MKKVYVNEKWCLACHLCEYYCAFAELRSAKYGESPEEPYKPIRISGLRNAETFLLPYPGRHCDVPLCVKGASAER